MGSDYAQVTTYNPDDAQKLSVVESPADMAMNLLNQNIERLSMQLGWLEDKLHPILNPMCDPTAGPEDVAAQSPLVVRIVSSAVDVDVLGKRLAALSGRIEL